MNVGELVNVNSKKVIFVILTFIMLFVFAVNYKNTTNISASTQKIMHTLEVKVALEKLTYNIKDAETNQRGYIITHDSIFLYNLPQLRQKIDTSLAALKALTLDNIYQQNTLDTLRYLVLLRCQYLDNTLKIVSEPLYNKTNIDNSVIEGKKIMDLVELKAGNMIDLESVYLKNSTQNYIDNISFAPLSQLFILLFCLGILAIFYAKIYTDFEKLKQTNESLNILTASFKHAEEIGKFSTWHWYLEKNKLVYSDNQYLLLGCEPQSFEPTIENYLKYVHPDDKNIIIEGGQKIDADDNPPSALFRIVRTDGEIRHIISRAKKLKYTDEKTILVGINQDITDFHLQNVEIEQKNKNLEAINKELSSFNHIASHDLQEPLRKIQIFASRFAEPDESVISERKKQYIPKIQQAASRMRLLIDSLLLFSRTQQIENIFEMTDLNTIWDLAQEELAEKIEEEKAAIVCADLPTLNVIPYQMQQLFVNILINALKYRKVDVPLVVRVDCELINEKMPYSLVDNIDLKNNVVVKYYKISIMDNGVGFQPDDGEIIFKLFQRLSYTEGSTGSGVGLAICKKIMENHRGNIIATGELGKGATFSILLPA